MGKKSTKKSKFDKRLKQQTLIKLLKLGLEVKKKT